MLRADKKDAVSDKASVLFDYIKSTRMSYRQHNIKQKLLSAKLHTENRMNKKLSRLMTSKLARNDFRSITIHIILMRYGFSSTCYIET